MPSLKPLLLFVGKFFGAYILLIILTLSLNLNDSHANLFAGIYGGVFENFFDEAQIQTTGIKPAAGVDDVQFMIYNTETIKKARSEAKAKGQRNVTIDGLSWSFNAQRTVLMPLLFLLALIIAYPADWKRKLIGTAIALLVFYLYYLFFMAGALKLKMHQDKLFFPQYQLSDFSAGFFNNWLYSAVETGFMVMFFVWVVTMIRVEDFKKLLKTA